MERIERKTKNITRTFLCICAFVAAVLTVRTVILLHEAEKYMAESPKNLENTLSEGSFSFSAGASAMYEPKTEEKEGSERPENVENTKDDGILGTEAEEETTRYQLTEHEKYLLARITMAEAENEPLDGKALVILVVLNRTSAAGFPDTIEEVIFEKHTEKERTVYQFSPVAPGGRWYTKEPDEECYKALDMVLSGWDESEGALYFEATWNGPDTWHSRNLEYIKTVGQHNFYK